LSDDKRAARVKRAAEAIVQGFLQLHLWQLQERTAPAVVAAGNRLARDQGKRNG